MATRRCYHCSRFIIPMVKGYAHQLVNQPVMELVAPWLCKAVSQVILTEQLEVMGALVFHGADFCIPAKLVAKDFFHDILCQFTSPHISPCVQLFFYTVPLSKMAALGTISQSRSCISIGCIADRQE